MDSANIHAAHGLAGGESPEVNIASHVSNSNVIRLAKRLGLLAVLPMVKATLLKVYSPLPSSIGVYLARNGIYESFTIVE
jgi:hypothetical protein